MPGLTSPVGAIVRDTDASRIAGSGFVETELDDVLRSNGIESVVVCGLSPYGCVNQTVLFAKLYGYDVAVAGNAHAGQSSTELPTSKGIPVFHRAWGKAGIRVMAPNDVPFEAARGKGNRWDKRPSRATRSPCFEDGCLRSFPDRRRCSRLA